MWKIDRTTRTLTKLDKPTLEDAKILERTDLQEYIFNSGSDFFAEIGERVFVLGKEITPSQTIPDRIDLLGIDSEGNSVIIELKRGSNKLHMLQAISYAGMVARWGLEDFRGLVHNDLWDQFTDFLDADIEDINRRQRLFLIAESYDYALLAGAEWLSEQYGVDIRCFSVSLATDKMTGSEYLACTSVFPPKELAEQATSRSRSISTVRPLKWNNWSEALSKIENVALRNFISTELEQGRDNSLRRRGLHFRIDGKRRWSVYGRKKHAYVWQRSRFSDDLQYWKSCLSDPDSVMPVKAGNAIRFSLVSQEDFDAFREAVSTDLIHQEWIKNNSDMDLEEDE